MNSLSSENEWLISGSLDDSGRFANQVNARTTPIDLENTERQARTLSAERGSKGEVERKARAPGEGKGQMEIEEEGKRIQNRYSHQ